MGACKGQASRDYDSLPPCAARMAHRRWETEAVARTSQGPAKTLDSSDRPVSRRAPALAQGAGGGALPMAYLTARGSRSEALPLGAAAMGWCAAHGYTRARGYSRPVLCASARPTPLVVVKGACAQWPTAATLWSS
jgi:hypothetical protein